MDSDVAKRAAERQKKIMANAEARLKKITDSAKVASSKITAADDGFVDFEVDSYVNEPSKIERPTPISSEGGVSSEGFSNSPSNSTLNVSNGFLHRTENDSETREFNIATQGGASFPPWNLMMPPQAQNGNARATGFQNAANVFGPLPDISGLTASNRSDLSSLLDVLSSLNSAAGPTPRTQPLAEEGVHPVFMPVLNMLVFFVLGVIARIFFQFSTLNINVYAPFMCLAIPLSIMSWGQRRPPANGIISALLLFVRNPRTQAMITNWVRLTTLIRGVCRLFACYFFTFIVTHAILELPSISSDIYEHSSPVNQ